MYYTHHDDHEAQHDTNPPEEPCPICGGSGLHASDELAAACYAAMQETPPEPPDLDGSIDDPPLRILPDPDDLRHDSGSDGSY